MSKCYPDTIPEDYANNDALEDAYRRGWNHGHGIACHNVPTIGETCWADAGGRMLCGRDNIRDVHQALCFAAEENSRQFSPFEFTAHKFNSADDDEDSTVSTWDLWEAFETGTSHAIFADLSEYTDEDYGIESESAE